MDNCREVNLILKDYYIEMLRNGRLLPIFINGKMKCMITFFIGNNEQEKYVRDDMWSVIKDEPSGKICWIDHLISDKFKGNHKLSRIVWNILVKYIKDNFPNVKYIRWNRIKLNGVMVFKKEI